MTDRLTIINADVLEGLKQIANESIQCCVTSPPYYGLRSYLKGDDPNKVTEIGTEEAPQAYVDKMVAVFREVKRVLRKDGVLWLNIGDSYGGSSGVHAGGSDKARSNVGAVNAITPSKGGRSKDLLMIPERVAMALQADGWYLRSKCPWLKRNAMPESTKDRPTTTVETMFMLTKNERYYYDAEAVKADCSVDMKRRAAKGHTRGANGKLDESRCDHDTLRGEHTKTIDVSKGRLRRSSDWFFESWRGMLQDEEGDPLAFVVNTKPYKGAHFACFPPDLIRPCVRACTHTHTHTHTHTEPDVVLDPFGGSGTTAQVALELGHHAILIELNAEYIPLIKQRCGSEHIEETVKSFKAP